MTNTTKLALLALLLAPFHAESLLADEPPSADAAALFAQLDVNKDGQISADEVPQEQQRLFERLLRSGDQNKDGKLTADEFAKALAGRPEKSDAPEGKRPEGDRPDGDKPRRAERLFKRLDANSDGKVVADEVPEERREMFALLIKRGDKDGDGALSREEFLQASPDREKKPEGEKKPDDEKKSEGQKKPAAEAPNAEKRPEGRPGGEQLFRRMDRNSDGKVTADEVPEERREFIVRLIKRVDKDGDGAMTAEEFAAAPFPARPDGKPGAGRPGRAEGRPGQGAPTGGLFRALDADHDGKLSGNEIKASAEVILKLDANGDGVVTVEELLPRAGEERANK